MKRLLLLLIVVIFSVTTMLAEEGMFLLNKLPMKELKKKGLQLTAEDIYSPVKPSISDAVIIVDGGGTGAFVSPKGLLITNHHVAYGSLQRVSTPEHNYIEEGMYAATPEEEIPAPGTRINVLLGFEDVTKQVLKGVKDKMDPVKRSEKIQKNIMKLTKATEGKNGVDRVSIVSMFSGKFFQMYKYKVIKDIRIVYAPPASIGVYGGDIDNWMWPRHTGDFTFMRAYVAPDGSGAEYAEENVPYTPKKYLPISIKGVREGDLTFIMGHPGSTQRYRTSYSAAFNQNFSYPIMVSLFKDIINILDEAGKNNKEIEIKYAGLNKGLNNAMKNRQGMIDGFKKLKIVQKKRALENEMTAFINAHPVLKKEYGTVLNDIADIYAQFEKNHEKDNYFRYLRIAKAVQNAGDVYRWSLEKTKKELDREPGYDDASIQRRLQRLPINFRNFVPQVDAQIFEYFLNKLVNLPEDSQFEAIKKIYQGKENKEKAVKEFVASLYANTGVTDLEKYKKMFDMSTEELDALNDPMLQFAKSLIPEIIRYEKEGKKFAGMLAKLRPKYAEMIGIYKIYGDTESKLPSLKEMKKASTDIYPDATFTQRFTYGTVKGYSPGDAVTYHWATTLHGVLEKDRDEEPFDAPDKLHELYNNKDFGPYADPCIEDVVVNFLHTTDITGGNSGSPVMNAKGEYIGIAFDGNYEAMTSDWQFDNDLTRTISCDARYILFVVDKFSNAQNLMNELEIRK